VQRCASVAIQHHGQIYARQQSGDRPNGRYAGKKAVIVKNFDEGDKGHRHYGYAVVAGVARAPLKVTRSMSQKRIAKRSKLKPFVKIVNYNHLMPTRYALDVDLKSVVDREAIDDAGQRTIMRKEVKKLFEERHKSGKNKWFFEKLRF
jgi:large subunit ribosomal protein L27e